MSKLQKNILRKKILYKALNRGSREMELIMQGFIKKYINQMSYIELQEFSTLLELDNHNLFEYLSKKSTAYKKILI